MVHTRINERHANPNPHINFISALPSGSHRAAEEDPEATELLRVLAAQLNPVMKAHGLTVNSFEETNYIHKINESERQAQQQREGDSMSDARIALPLVLCTREKGHRAMSRKGAGDVEKERGDVDHQARGAMRTCQERRVTWTHQERGDESERQEQ
ncbi:hypothetical protein JB92DRAFT_2827997 [Gautieria morchelliformis]|nr:hypothetical protein JB92DRAFT_2827997 [Gautieria morchelliformis]